MSSSHYRLKNMNRNESYTHSATRKKTIGSELIQDLILSQSRAHSVTQSYIYSSCRSQSFPSFFHSSNNNSFPFALLQCAIQSMQSGSLHQFPFQ
jgi:hypothetical protein